jgi:hypothetical protein
MVMAAGRNVKGTEMTIRGTGSGLHPSSAGGLASSHMEHGRGTMGALHISACGSGQGRFQELLYRLPS